MAKKINRIKKRRKNLKDIIEGRYKVLSIIIVLFMSFLIISLFNVQIIRHKEFEQKLSAANQNIVYGPSAPRGRIYDTKGRIIVDNKAVKVIYYSKVSGIKPLDEIELAKKVANIIEVDYGNLNKTNIKEYWLVTNSELGKAKISDEEWQKYEERKLTSDDIYNLKLERITDEDIAIYNDFDKEVIYIYYLMNKGYYSDDKIIKRTNVTDYEYAIIAELSDELPGFNIKLDWERYYPYGSTFKTILGNVSSNGIPSELKDYYLAKGYMLDDRVGTSYLEYQYDDMLRGTKNKYEVLSDNSLKLIEEGRRGNDLVLTIDIELQKEIESILEKEIKYSLMYERMIYYNRSFAIIAEPKTGSILAMAGVQVIKDKGEYKTYDYSAGIVTSPVTVGSVVKGASHIVGYNNGGLTIGEVRKDNCIKIASTPIKCSWTTLGTLNDITALKQSSNVYQFYTAINVGKGKYIENGPLVIDEGAFDIYRNTFAEFGLGVSTGIDLPVESLGYKGSNRIPGLLLDFAIGQYDTYTPIQLSQYISTIANDGSRPAMHLLKAFYEPTKEPLTNKILEYEVKIMNKVNTEDIYLNRVKEGFKAVMSTSGTGYNYVDLAYNPAGKTGTSESFLDTDNDGMVDTETLSNTFVAYAPYDNPRVIFAIVSPDIGYYSGGRTIRSYVNRRISYEVSKKYFEIYE